MAREPHYPKEAAIGSDAKPAPDEDGAAGKAPESKRTKHLVTGAAIGIGSAAIVAALLYANRSRDRKS
jgi:hypothetical protein